jgi:predicted restriction endonuclease
MEERNFEKWIIQNHPQITDTRRYPKTIRTISNHLRKKNFENVDLYSINNSDVAKNLKNAYFNIAEYHDLNERGNNMYSRAFDLYIQYLESNYNTDKLSKDIENILADKTVTNTEKSSLIQIRIGQGKFREDLVRLWGGCSLTGYENISLLIASHIKPWNVANNKERLDPYNGFLLLPNLDKVFDKGLITFEENGRILISRHLIDYELLGITLDLNIKIDEKHKPYLAYHRSNVFQE